MNNMVRNTLIAAASVAIFAAPAVAESVICTVSAPEIRLRNSPSKKAKVVAVLKKEARVTTADKCAGGWVKVTSEDGSRTGYVAGWALAAAAVPATAPAAAAAPAASPEASAAPKEVPSNEKLAIQITELRLSVLGVEREMRQVKKDVKKIKLAMKRNAAAK